jgi:hypothetical protein
VNTVTLLLHTNRIIFALGVCSHRTPAEDGRKQCGFLLSRPRLCNQLRCHRRDKGHCLRSLQVQQQTNWNDISELSFIIVKVYHICLRCQCQWSLSINTERLDRVLKGVKRFGDVLGAVCSAHKPRLARVIIDHDASLDQSLKQRA